ncbi:adenylyl-sulfate kinase [Nocardioides dilutus]
MSAPVPQHCPTPVELDDLELLLSGAVPGVDGFNQPDSPLTLRLPDTVGEQAAAAGAVELVDPEGLPLARVAWPDGTVEPLAHPTFGAFRHLRLTPAQYRAAHVGRTVVPVTDALTESQLHEVAVLGPVALLALVGHGTSALSPVALVRATLAAAAQFDDAVVVTVPLASHGDPDTDRMLHWAVLSTYVDHDAQPPLVELAAPDPGGARYPAEIADIVHTDKPPPDERGLVLFFTGLSGSGKSTLARALVDRLHEQGRRTVTSLDGDVVRRHLSAGLTFSKEDRETNIRRIGWVAAEIARHGGVAVVSPIAPFDETRQQVRAMVDDAGGAFFLVHVATPLEECERRDRKGLYAKARAGEIPEFTGISSPYEEPQDADVRVDTTGRTIEDALDDVLLALRDAGLLDLTSSVVEQRAPASVVETPTELVEQRAPASVVETPTELVEQRAPASVVETPTELVEQRASASVSETPTELVEQRAPASVVETPTELVEQRASASVVETPTELVEQRAPASVVETPTELVEQRASASVVETPQANAGTGSKPFHVLFVCTANICRSASLEAMARHAAGDDTDLVFSSAGTHGWTDHGVEDAMRAALPADLDTAEFRSRPLTRQIVEEADLVLTAETAHRSFILDDQPQLFRKVFTLGQFAEAVAKAPAGLTRYQLLEHVATTRGHADPGLDVPDPYRRGPAAAAACVTRLDELLRAVLPALSR